MPKTNHIKSPAADQDSLRGLGALDYTPAGKMHSTFKRLLSSFADELKPGPGKKQTVKCPGCNRKFKTNSGKIPEHRYPKYRWSARQSPGDICTQTASGFKEPKIIHDLQSVEINGFEIRKGDHVIWITYPHTYDFADWKDLKEYKIKGVHMLDVNECIAISFEGIDKLVPVHYITKAFIKL